MPKPTPKFHLPKTENMRHLLSILIRRGAKDHPIFVNCEELGSKFDPPITKQAVQRLIKQAHKTHRLIEISSARKLSVRVR